MHDLWPHETRACSLVTEALANHSRVCLRMATGAGKSRVACELIRDWLVCGLKVSLYTERPAVFAEALCNLFVTTADRSVENISACSVPECDDLQVSGLKKRHASLPFAAVIVLDSWNGVAQDLIARHLDRPNCRWLVMTAKKTGEFFYDSLIQCGTAEDARVCNGRKLWVSFYQRNRESDLTFAAARVQFSIDYGFDPPDNAPFMPKTEYDSWCKMKSVSRERLT